MSVIIPFPRRHADCTQIGDAPLSAPQKAPCADGLLVAAEELRDRVAFIARSLEAVRSQLATR